MTISKGQANSRRRRSKAPSGQASGPADAGRASLRLIIERLDALNKDPSSGEALEGILNLVSEALEADGACLYLVRNGVAGWGGPEGLSLARSTPGERPGEVAARKRQEQVVILEDGGDRLSGATVVAAPLMMGEWALGALEVMRTPGRHGFTAAERGSVRATANLLSRFLGYREFERRLAEQSRDLEARDYRLYSMHQVARALTSMVELDELVQLIADIWSEVVQVERTAVLLYSEEDNILEDRASKVVDTKAPRLRLRLEVGEALSEWLAGFHDETAPVMTADAPELGAVFPDLREQFQCKGLLMVSPMIYKHRLVGLLAVGRKLNGQPFNERDYEFLSTLAPFAANAIVNTRLYDMAIRDDMTQLFVSHYFRQRTKEELKRARRYQSPVSLILYDIDYFKQINDTFGHLVGDQVLREFAHVLKRSCRQDVDLVARYGGEEFIMLLPETPQEGALVVGERVRRLIESLLFCDGMIRLTTSAGVATYPDDARDYQELFERADIQLYRAKRAGRNRICAPSLELPQPSSKR